MKAWSSALMASVVCLAVSARAKPEKVTYCDLISSPDRHLGKQIRIRTIYKYAFEMQVLEPPDCCADKPVKIWVEVGPLNGRSRKLLQRFPSGMGLGLATFTGILESGGPFGDGGYRYRFTIDQIDAVEATAHPSATSPPNWEPQNCKPAIKSPD
jgi:hypothetical protein